MLRPLLIRLELPVMGSTRHVREWAVRVGENANYRRPATPVWTKRLDNVFLHRFWGPVIFAVVVIAVFQMIFAAGKPLQDMLQRVSRFDRRLDRNGAARRHVPLPRD